MAAGFFEFHAQVVRGKRGKSDVPPPDAAAAQPAALSVTEFSQKVAGVVRTGFPSPVWVRGEVSGYRGAQQSGHHYFRLKDDRSNLDCVVWAMEAARIRFKWSDGMEVLAYGAVATFAGKSSYQLKITQLLPVGQGALELAFRQLKERLENEGLFAPERKKAIPPFPRRIMLVTSRGAAGLADMLKGLTRFPWLKLMLFHVPVQGAAAHPAIAAALAAINRHAEKLGGVDVILLGRGGGSLEDLWAFNEEIVARAVAASRIPIVTGIGHEVDISIADLAADYHAHTPTEAAQVITQNWRLARDNLLAADMRLPDLIRKRLSRSAEQLTAIRRHEIFRRPIEVIIRDRQQRLDQRNHGLHMGLRRRLHAARERLDGLDRRLQLHRPTAVLAEFRQRLDRLAEHLAERHPRHLTRQLADRLAAAETNLRRAMHLAIRQRAEKLEAFTRHLDAIGPIQVLKRGYSITMRLRDRQIVRSASEIRRGDRMVTRFADSEIEWTAGDGQMVLFP